MLGVSSRLVVATVVVGVRLGAGMNVGGQSNKQPGSPHVAGNDGIVGGSVKPALKQKFWQAFRPYTLSTTQPLRSW